MMNFLKRLFVNIPDQLLSTVILAIIILVGVRGLVSVFQKPPTQSTIGMVLALGVFFGFMETIRPKTK